jgi:hypothetical protein
LWHAVPKTGENRYTNLPLNYQILVHMLMMVTRWFTKNRPKCSQPDLFTFTAEKVHIINIFGYFCRYIIVKKLPKANNRHLHRRKFSQSGHPDAQTDSEE